MRHRAGREAVAVRARPDATPRSSVDPEAEGVACRARVHGEHLIAGWVVGRCRRGLELPSAEFERQPTGGVQVVHVQVEVHLLTTLAEGGRDLHALLHGAEPEAEW